MQLDGMIDDFVCYNQTCFCNDAKKTVWVKKTLGCALEVFLNVSVGGFERNAVLYSSSCDSFVTAHTRLVPSSKRRHLGFGYSQRN